MARLSIMLQESSFLEKKLELEFHVEIPYQRYDISLRIPYGDSDLPDPGLRKYCHPFTRKVEVVQRLMTKYDPCVGRSGYGMLLAVYKNIISELVKEGYRVNDLNPSRPQITSMVICWGHLLED
jgi:hypothetical protein